MSEENKKSSDKSEKGQWHGGKGSIQRQPNKTAYDEGWERIFGKDKKDKSNNNS